MLYDYSDVYSGMSDTIAYIKELLSLNPSVNLVPDDTSEPEPISIETDVSNLDFTPIEEAGHSANVWAVDGGQGTIVRNNVFVAGMCRAGYVKFEDRKRSDELVTPLKLINLTYENYKEIYHKTHLEFHSRAPSIIPQFSETLGELRRLSEEYVILNCLNNISGGDLLILDGSLRGDKSGFMSGSMRKIKSCGAGLVGVSKASGILWQGGANLAAVLQEEGQRRLPGKSWWTKIGKAGADRSGKWQSDIYIARLNSLSQNAFRVDLPRESDYIPQKVFSVLSEFATDPFFLGYPYPLAAVHQMVRLTNDELMGFSLRLQDEALKAGINQGGWNMLFEDYHRILNFDVTQKRHIY